MAEGKGGLTVTAFCTVRNVVGNFTGVGAFALVGRGRFVSVPVRRANDQERAVFVPLGVVFSQALSRRGFIAEREQTISIFTFEPAGNVVGRGAPGTLY